MHGSPFDTDEWTKVEHKPPSPHTLSTDSIPKLQRELKRYTEYRQYLTAMTDVLKHSVDLQAAQERIDRHFDHQIKTFRAMLDELQSDTKLRDAVLTLIAKPNPPKTAFCSACDQLGLTYPSAAFQQSGPTWTVVITFKAHHSYSFRATAQSKSGAEFLAYSQLVNALH
jgi:hypothetical protein